METFEDGGILYEDLGNGQVRVIGPAQQSALAPITLGSPNTAKVAGDQLDNIIKSLTVQGKQRDLAQPIQDPNAPKLPVGMRWKSDGSAELIPGVPAPGAGSKTFAKERSDAIQGYQDAAAIARTVADLRQRFNQGPGQTGGIKGALDYLPTDENQQFNDAGQRSRGYVKRALGFTGGEGNTVAESTALYDPYLPDTWDKDGRIVSKIAALEQLGMDAERRSIAILGGVPDANGNIMPIDPNAGPSPLFQQQPTQRRDESPALGGVNKSANPFLSAGAPDPNIPQKKLGTQRRYSTDDDLAIAQRLEALYDSGASAGQISAAIAQFNQENPEYKGSVDPARIVEAVAWRDGVGKFADRKAYPYSKSQKVVTPSQSGRRSDTQIMANKALLHPLGTAATTATNALGFGALEALAPDAIKQQRETNPMFAWAGDVGGMIGGTAALAKAGQSAAAKYAPSLLGGGKKAAFARSVAPDAAYGAAYGGMTQGDPLTGAAYAAGGNLAGRGIAKVIGGIAKGVDDPAVQYLTQRDIPLSVGQTLGNRGIAGRTMNKLESLPVVGDLMARQRVQGLQAFEREALNDVLQPINGRVTQGGAEGLEQAQDAVSDAYGNALRGVNIPGDEQFVQETGEALARGSAIPDLGPKFRYAVDNRVGPMFEGGSLSGPELQQALQNLGSIRSSFAKEGPMGQFAAGATGQIDEALTGLVGRQAPDVMPQYNAAKAAFSRLAPFENARISGINQEAITPAQLSRAVTSNTKNFGGRAAAARGGNLSDLMKYGQEVLPSTVPNSGTADRLGGMGSILLPTALGGSAYGLSTMTDNPDVAIPLATLAALSTKTGQRAFQTAATKRPKAIRRASSLIGGRKAQKGLSGLVTAPLLVEDY